MAATDDDNLQALRNELALWIAKRSSIAADTNYGAAGAKPNEHGPDAIDHQGYLRTINETIDRLQANIQALQDSVAEQEAFIGESIGCA